MGAPGLEHPPENTGKTPSSDSGNAQSNVNGTAEGPVTVTEDPDFSLVVNAWLSLSLADRKAILAIVRRASTNGGRP
jgi:hypothetical protein